MPVGTAKFDLNRCNESPLRGEKPDFWPVSNTGSLPLRGILPVINKVDEICMGHDIVYEQADKGIGLGTRHDAHKTMLNELSELNNKD